MRILSRWIVTGILTLCIGVVMSSSEDFNGNTEAEIMDITTVYRLPDQYSSVATKEFHRRGNTKHMLLKTSDGKYLDSTEGIVPLECTLATEDCKWKLSPEWGYTKWSVSEDAHFTINVDDLALKVVAGNNCEEKNGGCEVFCQMVNGKANCSCPSGYTYNGACTYEDHEVTIISTPSNHSDFIQNGKKWLIIPPKNSTIQALVSVNTHYGSYYGYGVRVLVGFREIFQNGTISNKEFSKSLTDYEAQVESNSILEIKTKIIGVSASLQVDFMRNLLTLQKDHGWLTYKIVPDAGYICVCIIYTSTSSKEIIQLKAQFPNGTISEALKFTERKFNKWNMQSFKLSLQENYNEEVQLNLTASGKSITIHSIYGCSNEDVLFTRVPTSINEIPLGEVAENFESDPTGRCHNGGKFIQALEKCTCPEGYMGDACEEACGQYNFGPNCSTECSIFDWGCRNMIFCKDGFPCLCAPGFEGTKCNQVCSGSFGPHCLRKCSRCFSGQCDPYTGECNSHCESGFRPPLCQIPYLYSKYSPKIVYLAVNSASVEFDTDELQGQGNILYYQLQYTENKDIVYPNNWIELQPRKPEGRIITANISNLSPGTEYAVRVIFIDEDGNSYNGHLVPEAQFSTLCTGPTPSNYIIKTIATASSIGVLLKYNGHISDCPVTGYTVVLHRKWHTIENNVTSHISANTGEYSYIFENLLPDALYGIKVRANTRNGPAPSSTVSEKTKNYVPLRVSNLTVQKNGWGKLLVSWKSPKFTGGTIRKYIVKYTCLNIIGCYPCNDDQKEVEVQGNQHSVNISNLRHHTQYSIKVAAMSGAFGPFSLVFGLTEDKVPDAAPRKIENSQVSSTNSSVTIQWLPVDDCALLNGYLVGYHYELLTLNNTILTEGETVHTNITLFDLNPRTAYKVHVFAVSSGGLNAYQKLVINATTAATVPDKVQDLTIYKRGRRVLGIRWSKPISTYGEIKSFSVSYCQLNNCVMPVAVTVAPEPCTPWPSQFCHTITGVLPNTRYSVSVRARNVAVEEYGSVATVSTTTSEGAPESPVSLRVSSRSTNSLILEWKPPQIFNGVLRSFLIDVEHMDSSNATKCCASFPLQEFVTNEEEEKYYYQVTGLSPASKYVIGVSAKTKSIGPATFVDVSTPPEVPELIQIPQLIAENTVKITSEGRFPGLDGTYLLIIFPKNGTSRPTIWDPELSEKFHSIIKRNFYAVAEIDADDLIASADVEIGKGIPAHNGTIATLEDPVLTSNFDLGLALVLGYNGAANVGVIEVED